MTDKDKEGNSPEEDQEHSQENGSTDNSSKDNSGQRSEKAHRKVDHDPTKIDINPDDIKNVPKTIWSFIKSTLSIKKDVDYRGTVDQINSEIEFKGHNVWILVFSILVCSIGLDADNVAVVIGAMLISPLMGPIKGVGMAVGTNNFKLLMKSLVNFGVMVGISILASWIFFKISPFKDPSNQILARTEPDFRDVLIAFFGGFSGIIATTQKNNTYIVISGVAIATALMPPLCTAGFMLANGDWTNLFNSAYLFFINSLMICLASLIVIRYLRFPLVEFVNPKTERKVKIILAFFMLLILIPSGVRFYSVMQENSFKRNARSFVSKEIRGYPGISVTKEEYLYNGDQEDKKNIIKITLVGLEVEEEVLEDWKRKLKNYDLENSTFKLVQNKKEYTPSTLTLQEHYALEKSLREEIRSRDVELSMKEKEIGLYKNQLKAFKDLSVARIRKLDAEMRINFPDVHKFSYSIGLESKANRVDTVVQVFVNWKPTVPDSLKDEKRQTLEKWLRIDLERKNIKVLDK